MNELKVGDLVTRAEKTFGGLEIGGVYILIYEYKGEICEVSNLDGERLSPLFHPKYFRSVTSILTAEWKQI